MSSYLLWLLISCAIAFSTLRLVRGRSYRVAVSGFIIAALAIAAGLLSPLYYRHWPQTAWENNSAVQVTEHEFRWMFNNKFFSTFSPKAKVMGRVTAFTPNPKLREMIVYVEGEISDMNRFYRLESRRKYGLETPQENYIFSATSNFNGMSGTRQQEVAKIVSYQMLEFLNFNSLQLAEFYNHMDSNQQQRMRPLVENWINPRLQDEGVRVRFMHFSLQ